jgi:hypothetical protein
MTTGSAARLSLLLVASTLAVMALCSSASGRAVQTPRPFPPPRQIEMACYHPSVHRYTPEIRPHACVFAGAALYEDGTPFKSFAIKDLSDWSAYTQHAVQGSHGVNVRNGRRVRVWASDPIRCRDDRVFFRFGHVYEFAVLDSEPFLHEVKEAHDWYVRLPVCGELQAR